MSYGVKVRHAPPGGEHRKYKNKQWIYTVQKDSARDKTFYF